MSVTEGYTQAVRTQGSESSATLHAKFIRFHYVLEEISGGYNATITFQTRGNGSSCVARNGYSYVTIQGNTTRIDWTSQNELSMPKNTNWIDIISNTVYVPASNAVTLVFSGGNMDISEAGGSSSTAFNLNGTASDTLQLTPVMIWHGRIYGSANSQTRQILDFYGPVNGEAELANKVYGSVNGQAKIIHQGFGHIDYGQSGNEYGHTGGDGD